MTGSYGIVWPVTVAPYHVAPLFLGATGETEPAAAADADLIGCPMRLSNGIHTGAQSQAELKGRAEPYGEAARRRNRRATAIVAAISASQADGDLGRPSTTIRGNRTAVQPRLTTCSYQASSAARARP